MWDETNPRHAAERRELLHDEYEFRLRQATQTAFWGTILAIVAIGLLSAIGYGLWRIALANPKGFMTVTGVLLGFAAVVSVVRYLIVRSIKREYATKLMLEG